MIKNIFVLVLVFCSSFASFAQTGGYFGKKHHFTIEANLNPLGINLLSSRAIAANTIFTFRPGYELVLGKSFSMSIDAGYYFEGNKGEVAAKSDQESILFSQPNSSSSQVTDPTYYVSGNDFRLKFNIYNYRTKGIIAPLGSHIGLVFSTSFSSTSYSESIIYSYQSIGAGIEFGRRHVLFDFVTLDYGIISIASMNIKSDFSGTSAEDSAYRGFSSTEQSVEHYFDTQAFSFYLKVGYLL